MFDDHVDHVGPSKQFRNKKELWKYITSELYEVLGVNRTWEQLVNRHKTVIRQRRRTGAVDALPRKKKTRSNEDEWTHREVVTATTSSPGKQRDDVKEEPIENMTVSTSDTDRPWQMVMVETIRNTMLEIDNRRAAREAKKEKARQVRHEAIIALLNQIQQ